MRVFGTLSDGAPVHRVTIAAHGLTASVMTLGASLQDLRLDGHAPPLVLGFPDLDPYLDEGRDFGAIIGRTAGRIAGASVRISGISHDLDANDHGRHCLNGGNRGCARRNWHIAGWRDDSIALTARLPAGEMGYPGNMDLRVTYALVAGPALRIVMIARSDATTLCSLAPQNHFNLGADLVSHRLAIAAESRLMLDPDGIPTGLTARLGDLLLTPHPLADLMALGLTCGDFCLATRRHALPQPAATLTGAGLRMEILSTEPGLHVDDGAAIPSGAPGLAGKPYGPGSGLLLRPQLWPDAPHYPHFPSALLHPGTTYRHETLCRFSHL